jgi:hypothetical protein
MFYADTLLTVYILTTATILLTAGFRVSPIFDGWERPFLQGGFFNKFTFPLKIMSTLHHTIENYLYNNMLTGNPNDDIARVSPERPPNVQQVCITAMTRGGTDISDVAGRNHTLSFSTSRRMPCCAGNAGMRQKEPRTAVFKKTLTVK